MPAERMKPADFSGGPGQEREFVDRRVEALAEHAVLQVTRGSGTKCRKAIDELVRVDVEPVRPSVVEEIPDHFDVDSLAALMYGSTDEKS